MGLNKYHIGDLIEPYSKKCGISNLQPDDVSGINIDKEFFEPAKQVGGDTSGYKVVPPYYFACNLMHVGRDEVLPVALNHSGHNKIVSSAYSVFRIKNEKAVMKEYFYILLKSSEKDRYFWFHTDSSIRQSLPWEDFCDIEISLPTIEQQRKFVNVYLSLQNNLDVYQSKVDELKLVCDGYLDKLKNENERLKIGGFIEQCDERNEKSELGLDNLKGISIEKKFIETKADMAGVSLTPYLQVKPNYFAYVPVTSRNGEKITLAHNSSTDTYIVSSAYCVFKVKDENVLDPHYLMMFFTRKEFDRYARFNSWGSARETFDWPEMCDVCIPVPSIDIQRSIASIYKVYKERQAIAAQLKEQLTKLCPILIKGSLQ